MVIQNRLLIAGGATVAASGSILTHIMCKAMNRDIAGLLFRTQQSRNNRQGKDNQKLIFKSTSESITQVNNVKKYDEMTRAIYALKDSKKIIIIPGYGMALSQAQFKVDQLARLLDEKGKEVKFAIHPVAGRMPGHMNVLLAEANVDYERLVEMDEINPEFKTTDLAIVIGASDVVNPAAIQIEGTPISGMPILTAHDAKKILVCNIDERPGYSGVENPLYDLEKTITLFGDAKNTIERLIEAV